MAVKYNKIILKGVRNPTDGLWDIPVQKTHISPQNCELPPPNAGIYKSVRQHKQFPVLKKNSSTRTAPNPSRFQTLKLSDRSQYL